MVRDGSDRGGRAAVRAVFAALLAAVAVVGCGGEPPADTPEPDAPVRPVATDMVLDAAWSPDGARIVVAWDRGQGSRLYGLLPGTVDAPPSPSQGLPLTYGQETHPTWSPDRLWVAFESRAGGNADIYRIRPDGSGSERLTEASAVDADPAWSPAGDRIAFVSDRGGDGLRLHMMDPDGENVRRVPFRAGTAHSDPVWAPDGNRLVVVAQVDGVSWLYVVDPETGASGRLGAGAQPAMAHDGSRVYYAEHDSVFWRPAEGGLRRYLIADARSPEPGPDGRRVAFVRGNPPTGALYLLDLETSAQTRITP